MTRSLLEQLRGNIIQIYAEGFGFLKKWVPETVWINPAFVFDDRQHWARFVNSELVGDWFDKVEEVAGVKILGDPTLILARKQRP